MVNQLKSLRNLTLLALFSLACEEPLEQSLRSGGNNETEPEAETEQTGSLQAPNSDAPSNSSVTLANVSGNSTSSVDGVENSGALVLGLWSGQYGLSGYGLSGFGLASGENSYIVRTIGGGAGNVLAGPTSYSGNTFTIPNLPTTDEVLIEFTLADSKNIRCLAKPGDNGILCNRIADTIFTAFEKAMGKTLTDPSFKGKKLSKLANAIVDATKIDSDAIDTFKNTIKDTCEPMAEGDTKKECYKDAVLDSPFNATFQVMQAMAGTWTVESIVMLVTDVFAFDIQIDVDDLYSSLFDDIDAALGSDFGTNIRTLVTNVVNAQVNQYGNYPFKIKCMVNIHGQEKFYAPEMNASQARCNPQQANEIMVASGITGTNTDYLNSSTDIYKVIFGLTHDPIPCSSGTCHVQFEMVLQSLNLEADRNDITGTRRTDHSDRKIYLLDIMPQVVTILIGAGVCNNSECDSYTYDSNNAAHVAGMQATKNYWLGLYGLYRMMNDTSFANVKLSLDDLHEIFTGDYFMRTRVSSYGPRFRGISGSGSYTPPIVTFDNAIGGFKQNDVFKEGANGEPPTATQATIDSIFSSSVIPFDHTFGPFTVIPDSYKIERDVFNASRHEEWNPMGEKYLYVARYQSSDPKMPITCKMVNAGPGFQMGVFDSNGDGVVNGSDTPTSIVCDTTYTGVSCDVDGIEGKCTYPANYEYPFVLFERGWYGDDKGRLFKLGSRKTGREIGHGHGRGIMVKEAKDGNPNNKCSNGFGGSTDQRGTIIEYMEEFHCGHDTTCEERIRAYCMDMTALGASSRRFFPGGEYEISGTDESTGESWNWKVPLISVYDGSDHDNDYDACLDVNSGTFASGSDSLATLNVTASGANEVQTVSFSATPDAGTFKLRFNWEPTGALAYNVSAAAVETALESLSSVTSVSVTGSVAAGFTITFDGADASINKQQIRFDSNSLTASSAAVDITTATTTQGGHAYVNSINGITGASIVDCSSTEAGGKQRYYLVQWEDFASGATDAQMYVYLLDKNSDRMLHFVHDGDGNQDWTETLARLAKDNIETHLATKTVGGAATAQVTGMRYINPQHDAKFDPYCDDLNGNGYCDCYPIESLSADRKTVTYGSTTRPDPKSCGLSDKAAEPTISQLPYCPSCGSDTTNAQGVFTTFGGKAGSELATLDLDGINMDVQRVFVCQYKFSGESNPRRPKHIRWDEFDEDHEGCPASAGASFSQTAEGPIRLMNPKPMNNAYEIGRPNTMIKVINYATKTVGQGTTLDRAAGVFELDELMAWMALRMMVPPDAGVFDSSNNPVHDAMLEYATVHAANTHVSPFSALLKAYMYKAGKVTLSEIQATFSP